LILKKADKDKKNGKNKKNREQKTGLIAKTQSGQTAEDFRLGQIHDYERIQQVRKLFAGKRLLKEISKFNLKS
jgi:hypothetical protein